MTPNLYDLNSAALLPSFPPKGETDSNMDRPDRQDFASV